MLDTEKTTLDTTHWQNMTGMKQIEKMFGTKMVHFVSHSTGCFYGRKYIAEVMSETKYKHNTDHEDYPLVDKFIMLSGPNNGVNFDWDAFSLYLALCDRPNLSNLSPCEKFYAFEKYKEFNKQRGNQNVKYYSIGGYSGWRSENIPFPLRPYCDFILLVGTP